MSQSRGPALGWMASTFILILLLSLFWRKRWLTLATVGAAVALGVFLLVFNIKGGPLEGLRKSPAIGRFGLLLDAESNSALVRRYIWEGAADLVSLHAPLEFPDGSLDRFNFLRPILGYGPESMYVAYNPFYVPDLAHVEKRNASPDRSHNETWDSLVITGVLGILVYLSVFMSVFYYGLKWTGFIPSQAQRRLFFLLTLGGGLVGAVGMGLWRGIEYFGVGMPFGILIGLILYITEVAISIRYEPPKSTGEIARHLTLIILLTAVIAHFVEINFGIAIAVTRTYFWVFTALLLSAGYILPRCNQYDAASLAEPSTETPDAGGRRDKASPASKKRRGGREPNRTPLRGGSFLDKTAMVPALLTSIVIATLGYNFLTNSRGLESAGAVIWNALTRLPNRSYAQSFGILALVLTTWLIWNLVLAAEESSSPRNAAWMRSFGLSLAVSALIALGFWLLQAGRLASIARTTAANLQDVLDQVGRYENMLGVFYVVIALIIAGLGFYLPEEKTARLRGYRVAGAAALAVGSVVVALVAATTNLRVIQADIAFKLAEPFTRGNQWPVAISIYNRANQMAPTEDYYYLFLGRAYLEHAKTITDAAERENLINQAAEDLKKAQAINPLNTDHTANLARLYSLWASYVPDTADKQAKASASDEYFSRAVALSPNNARLWSEWALLYLNLLGQADSAVDKLNHALEIDPQYHWTYALLGDFHARNSRASDDPAYQKEELAQAAEYYSQALALPTPGEPAAKYNYAISLAGVQAQLGRLFEAIESYQSALDSAPQEAERWRVEETIGNLHIQLGDAAQALIRFQNAYNLAPDAQKERLQSLIRQLSPP
jgi:tetratricopeptide (TPR) repeat protein